MPNMFGAPNQAYTDKLMAYIANTVSTVLSINMLEELGPFKSHSQISMYVHTLQVDCLGPQ